MVKTKWMVVAFTVVCLFCFGCDKSLPAPQNVRAEDAGTMVTINNFTIPSPRIKISWDAVKDVAEYHVYCSEKLSIADSAKEILVSSDVEVVYQPKKAGDYYFWVKSAKKNKLSIFSSSAKINFTNEVTVNGLRMSTDNMWNNQ
jgi:hypothetical protein